MCSIAMQVEVLGAQPLSGAVEDDALTGRAERLHRVETTAAAESCAASPRSTPAKPDGAERRSRPPTCSPVGCRLTRGETRAQTDTALGLKQRRCGQDRRGSVKRRSRHAPPPIRIRKVREQLDQLVANHAKGWTADSSASTSTPEPTPTTRTRRQRANAAPDDRSFRQRQPAPLMQLARPRPAC